MFKCIGCKACELICSYHHKKVFMPSISSIKVNELEKGRYEVSIIKEKHSQRIECNNCKNEEFPLCVMIYPTEVICIGPSGIDVIQA